MSSVNIRCLLLAAVISLSCAATAQTPESADNILAAAQKEAKNSKKNVFVLFHASWCGWCHKMDTSLNDPRVKKFFDDNYVIKHLVVYESANKKQLENPGALELLNKYNGNDKGIPYWMVFDASGKLLADSKYPESDPEKGDNTGCPASEKEVAHFINVLKATSSLKPEALEKIRVTFRENAD